MTKICGYIERKDRPWQEVVAEAIEHAARYGTLQSFDCETTCDALTEEDAEHNCYSDIVVWSATYL